MVRSAVGAAAVFAVALTFSATAQQPQSGQTPVFRSTVDLVHLDVSVLDKDRHPVRGLTEKDFTITEDEKPQAIAAFTAVDIPENPPKPAAWSGRAPADVQSNEGDADPEGRLFVLLLDDALIPPDPKSLETARDLAKRFIEKVTPVDRVAVVFSEGGRNQNFTNDRARLLQAIESLKNGYATHLLGWGTARDPATVTTNNGLVPPEIPGPMGDPDIMFRQASVTTLRLVAETLISAPQRRKALIFVSPGVTIDTMSAANIVKGGMEQSMAMKEANRRLFLDMPELFARMQRANVTIYPVDPCGANGFEAYVMNAASGLLALRSGNVSTSPPDLDWLSPPKDFVPAPGDLARHVSALNMDFLQTAAANTGGLAVVNTNDFGAGIDRIFDENSSYYVMGYQQPAGQAPGSNHRIKVTVDRPGVIVRTRSGYLTDPAPKRKNQNAEPPSALDKAIVGAVPDGRFPMRVALAPFSLPGKKDPVITIALGLTQPPVNARSMFAVEVQTNAYTSDGRPKFVGQRHTATVTMVPTKDNQAGHYDLLTQISLPPGRYQLRLSANRPGDGVSGSLYADLDVPDFAAPLAVSGVVVETVPGGASAPPGAFDSFLPVIPTTVREFTPNQDVTAFMRVYQNESGSAKPVKVTTRIVNESDAAIGNGKDMIYGTDFRVGGRAADYRFPIAVKLLPAGLYLLTLDFELDGNIVHRSVQFKVKK